MQVVVRDNKLNRFIKVQVYAIINSGIFEKYLVLMPTPEGDMFKIINVMEKYVSTYALSITRIVNDQPKTWISFKNNMLYERLGQLSVEDRNKEPYEYHGFPEIYESNDMFADLLLGKAIPLKGSGFESLVYDDRIEGWSYIENEDDIKDLMSCVFGFHDSLISEINYVSGATVSEDKAMSPDGNIKKLTVVFESQACSSFELVFEGVYDMHLHPADDDTMAILFGAEISLMAGAVWFTDNPGFYEIDQYRRCTVVGAFSLRWRWI